MIFKITKEGASIFILCNLIGGIILLSIGIYTLLKHRRKLSVAGFICLGLSGLMFLVTLTNFLFSHFI